MAERRGGNEREGEEESRGENRGRRGERTEHGRGRVLSCRWRDVRGRERWRRKGEWRGREREQERTRGRRVSEVLWKTKMGAGKRERREEKNEKEIVGRERG